MVRYMENKRTDFANNPASIRFILTGSCQSGCNFCHLEGNRPAGYLALHPDISGWKKKGSHLPLLERLSYPAKSADVKFIAYLAGILKINKIHLTGGEPTLHPEIGKITRSLKSKGLHVAMTTHGEYAASVLDKLFIAGIDAVVFSLHCATAEEYLTMDLIAQDIDEKFGLEKALLYAKTRLATKKTNIISCLQRAKRNKNFQTAANHVIRNAPAAIGVIKFCNEYDLDIRLQRNMNKPAESNKVIEEITSVLNAKKITEETGLYDSSLGGTAYEYRLKNGQKGSFRLKDFSPIYLPFMCNGCVLKGTSNCRERFYGIRVQHGYVRLCIDRHDEKTLYDFDSLMMNKFSMIDELKAQYHVG